jgi:hypothetical protein
MIVNLHSKDATINKIGDGIYQFTFNLNGIIHDRFSNKTRLYIQDFNLCELYDNSSSKDINGSFQLRCNFINGKEVVDSNRDSVSNNIIFAGNLTSYKNFINTNPMFMYNYKINESTFNTGFLNFTLQLYDEEGSIFSTWTTTEYTLDETSSQFATYNTELNDLNDTRQLVVDTKELIKDSQEKRAISLDAFDPLERELLRAIQELSTALISRINDTIAKASAFADGKTRDEVEARHQEIIQAITNTGDINTLIGIFNEANFVIGFPYYTGNNSGIRKKYTYVKQSALPNYMQTVLDAQQLAQDINNLNDSPDFFIRHVLIYDKIRTDEFKLPKTDVYFKSTSTYQNYNYFINFNTNTQQATGIINLKIKNYFNNEFNITIERILPNSATDDSLEDIPDPVLTFYVQGLENLGSVSTTSDLLSFKVRKEDIIKNSLILLNNAVNQKTSKVASTKTTVPTITTVKTISIDDNIRSKLPNINLSMVLYDEEIESESIKGTETQNTISKSFLPQYRRI